MANTKQAIKRHGQSLRRRDRNRYNLSTLKSHLKRTRLALDANDSDAPGLVQQTIRHLDRVATKGTIHRRRASRLKSRLMQRLQKASTS